MSTPVATLVAAAQAEGVTLTCPESGRLTMTGERLAVARWTPVLRPHKAALLVLLGDRDASLPSPEDAQGTRRRSPVLVGETRAPSEHLRKNEPDPARAARRLWHITEPGGACWLSSFTPAASLEQVLQIYSGAVVQPVPDPDQGRPLPAAVVTTITNWLDRLGEDDPDTRREVLQRARDVPEARDYYLQQASRPAPPGPSPDATGTAANDPKESTP